MLTEVPRDPILRLMRGLATVAVLLSLVVTSASAWLRLAQDGRICAGDARCAPFAASRDTGADATQNFVRLAHRTAAGADTLLVVGLAFLGWKLRRRYPRLQRLSLAALGVLLFLAALGAVMRGSRLPAVTLGNLAGGWMLIVLLARVRACCDPAPAMSMESQRWMRITIALLGLQLLLGSLANAGFAGVDCGLSPVCDDAWAGLSILEQLDLTVVQMGPGGQAIPSAAARSLLWMHRATGFIVAACLAVMGLHWRRRAIAPRAGTALLLLVLLQLGSAASSTTLGLPLPAASLHSIVAALLLVVLAYVHACHRRRSTNVS
jgi:cytochrome c oxidase assembly protein subunit 15